MTKIEKEVLINALASYRTQQLRKAARARKNLKMDEAATAQAEANKAHALVGVFCNLLDVPCGEARI